MNKREREQKRKNLWFILVTKVHLKMNLWMSKNLVLKEHLKQKYGNLRGLKIF